MLKNIVSKNAINLLGWKTNRKIVVIESDDWGSIRMPSRQVYEQCMKSGYPVDKNFYERYDALESEDDLTALFDVLDKFKDKNGRPAIFTANAIVANPDFTKIANGDNRDYHYELVTETFKKYPKHSQSFSLWKEGQDKGLFRLQFHGREHLNVSHFMNDLRNGVEEAKFALQHHMPGCINKKGNGNKYVMATRYTDDVDKEEKKNIILKGLEHFKEITGQASDTYIATNYVWSPDFNESLEKQGIKSFQGFMYQLEPIHQGSKYKKYFHYTGQKNKLGQYYTVRNCTFEPSASPGIDSVSQCISSIALAFKWKTPAIISSHRINFIGYIDEANRKKNLVLLGNLLKEITRRWPDVEFVSSDELLKIMGK